MQLSQSPWILYSSFVSLYSLYFGFSKFLLILCCSADFFSPSVCPIYKWAQQRPPSFLLQLLLFIYLLLSLAFLFDSFLLRMSLWLHPICPGMLSTLSIWVPSILILVVLNSSLSIPRPLPQLILMFTLYFLIVFFALC